MTGYPLRLLASAEFARAYTIAALLAAFAALPIERLTSSASHATIVATLAVIGVAVLFARREELSPLRLAPSSLLAFLALALVSVFWTFDHSDTLVGWAALLGYSVLAITIGHIRDTLQTVRAIGDTLRWLLIASLGIEIVSGVLLDRPLPLLGVEGDLAVGGPIQGIFGTRNLLGFVAVIALITFIIEWRTRSVSAPVAVGSTALGGFLALLSASPTVVVLAAGVGVASLALMIVRHTPSVHRTKVQWALGAVVAAGLATAFGLRHQIIRLLDAGSDFSMRADLWNEILDFVAQRPILGWGWSGPWRTTEFPFTLINIVLDEQHKSALNSYFDVLLQLGAAGLVLFLILGGVAIIRSWLVASTRRPVLYAWT
ncbi:MAG: O-antigen ligase family protein, partial [Microbacterium sp.]